LGSYHDAVWNSSSDMGYLSKCWLNVTDSTMVLDQMTCLPSLKKGYRWGYEFNFVCPREDKRMSLMKWIAYTE
jgi:hypothetical protein